MVKELLRFSAFERSLAHVIAGWVAKVPELDDKLPLAARLEGTNARAIAMRNHALALLERDEAALVARKSWIVVSIQPTV